MNSKVFCTLLVLAMLCALCPEVESKRVVYYNSQGSVGTSYILNGRNFDCPNGQKRDHRKRCRTVRRFKGKRRGKNHLE